MSARLVVDLSNKSAWLENLPDDEHWAVSGVTRTTALPLAAQFGYQPVGPWAWTSPPDGFWCLVEPIERVKD